MRIRLSLLGFAIGLSVASLVQAQDQAPPAEAVPSEPTASIADLLGAGEVVEVDYDPEDRRDPFKSLLVGTELPGEKRVRPPGIPGLLIDELNITGIFRTSAGFVVQVQSADKEKSYLLKQGDQLFDGDVVTISSNQVVFKQINQDPTALKPFREVVKPLRPEGSK